MIGWLRGTPRSVGSLVSVIDVAGVGYEVLCVGAARSVFESALDDSKEVELFIHTDVREDAIQLFGFESLQDRRVFLLLTSVKGVGARLAAQILGGLSARDLLRAIGMRNHAGLQVVKGVGKKTAERIVVELADRVGELTALPLSDGASSAAPSVSQDTGSSVDRDARAALLELGFPSREVERVLLEIVSSDTTSVRDAGAIVHEALRRL